MKHIISAVLFAALIAGLAPANAQQFNTIPDKTVIGRVGVGNSSGPAAAIPFSVLGNQILAGASVPVHSNYGSNLFVGTNTGVNETSTPSSHNGDINTFIGQAAGQQNTTGYANTFLGASAGNATTTGTSNTYLGTQAGILGTTADSNVGIGVDALFNNIAGWNNVAIGHHVGIGMNFTSGQGEGVYIGAESNKVGVGGISTVCIGYRSCYNADALSVGNTIMGHLAAFGLTDGTQNVLIGKEVGQAATTASNNSIIGYRAGFNLSSGNYNSANGYDALFGLTTGSNNVAVGNQAGFSETTGSSNVFLGNFAGYYETGNGALYIDNQQRANLSDARAKALVFGVFDAAVANQSFQINGTLKLPVASLLTATSVPTTPSSGFGAVWFDSGTTALRAINSVGSASTTVFADAGASNNFLTGITSAGVITKAQPSAANLSNGTTGSGSVVLATSPTLVTPALGAASATTLGIGSASLGGYVANIVGGNATSLKVDNGGQQFTDIDYFNNGVLKSATYWDNIGSEFVFRTVAATNGNIGFDTNGTRRFTITKDGQVRSQGSAPSAGTCGTSPSVAGTDVSGQITTGSTATTACTLTFAATWPSAPNCTVTPFGAANSGLFVASTGTTSMVINYSSATSQKFNYHCISN